MLRDGDPSHELTPKANTAAKRNRDRIPHLVCLMAATLRIPPIGGYRVPHARTLRPAAFDWLEHSQIRPKCSGNSKPPAGALS
jgi:hypothetical protein